MAFVPEAVRVQLELCLTNGILDFAKTGLADLPEQVLEDEMPYVTRLDFSGNRLTELSPFITRLPALEVLDLTENNLMGLPNEVGRLSKLRSLRVGKNGIKVLPRTLGLLAGTLKELVVDMEGVTWPSSPQATGLETEKLLKFIAAFYHAELKAALDLTGWGFEEIPEEVFGEGQLTCLKLGKNKLSGVPERIDMLHDLAELWLSDNLFVDAFPAELLALTTLTVLNMQGNQIRHLATDLSAFVALRELRISDNILQSLPASIGSLRTLSLLDVSFNQLTILPPEIGTCISLKTIRVRSNQLKTIPLEMTRLGQMEELLLDGNPIVRLPPRVATMPLRHFMYDIEALQSPPLAIASRGTEFTLHYLRLLRAAETRHTLVIDDLGIDMVPSEACEIGNLTHLSVQHNQIYIIPPHILLLTVLESLNLAHNQIESIPNFMTQLSKLSILDLSHNALTTIPRAFGHAPAITSLVLDGNRITSPPPVILEMGTQSVMFYLQQLCDAETSGKIYLPGLALTELPRELQELQKVTSVDVSRNQLTTLRPLNKLRKVTALNISNNRLKEVDDDLMDLLHLQELNLSHNRIVHLVSSIRNMTALRKLVISHNPIQELPKGLWALNGLEVLDVVQCDIRFPPQDVVAKGVKSLLNFQRMMERGRYTNRLDLSGVGFHELTVPDDLWAGLVMLNIDRNYVSQLPAMVQECTLLQELRAANNQLVKLPPTLGSMQQLALLDVRNNALQSLPESFALLTALTRLRASGNRLITLPDSWFALQSIVEVDVSDNSLIQLPNSLFGLPKLGTLRLGHNKVKQIPLSLGGLTGLEVLTINDNELVRLPLSVRFLTGLVEFDAKGNGGMDLPPQSVVDQGIAQIRSFVGVVHDTIKSKHLNLSGFNLSQIPKFVTGMTGLTALTIAHNKISDLEAVTPILNGLTSLNALENSISSLPIRIGGLTSLRELLLDQKVWDAAAADLLLTSSRHVREYLRKILDAQVHGTLALNSMGLRQLPTHYFGWSIWSYLTGITDLNLSNNMLASVIIDPVPTGLTRLELSGNHLRELDESLGKLLELRYAGLNNNRFAVLPVCVKQWAKVRDLTLADNELTSLGVHTMGGLKELVTCDCRNNQLTEIKAPIWTLPNLRDIAVQGNNILSPPMAVVRKGKGAVMAYFKALDVASQTKKLSLNKTELTYLPSEVMAIKTVQSLSFDGNLVITLPPQIGQMRALTSLSARGNQLSSLPDTLADLLALCVLDLGSNQLSELPIAALAALTQLTRLDLSQNQLTTPPFELCRSSVLTHLALGGNPALFSPPPRLTADKDRMGEVVNFLRAEAKCVRSGRLLLGGRQAVMFPSEVLRVADVTEINLAKNMIEALPPEIEQLSHLRRLVLDDNVLDDLPPELGGCTALTELRIASNRVSELPEAMSALLGLTLLDASNNQLSEVPPALQPLSQLSFLNLRSNLITHVGDWIASLRKLATFNVSNNQITALPFTIAELPSLTDLKYHKNEIEFPPLDILDGGLKPLQQYLGRLRGAHETHAVDLSGIPMRGFAAHATFAALRLTKLVLNHNKLQTLSPTVSALSYLAVLDVRDNELAVLPAAVAGLVNLEALHADRNMLGSVEGRLGACTRLSVLTLTDNMLTELPPSLGWCTSLTELAVSGNTVVSPPDMYVRKRPLPWLLAYLRALSACAEDGALSLISMGLSDLPADVFELGGRAHKLLLNRNQLRDLPERLLLLSGLTMLSLANNKLMRLPTTVCDLPALQALILDDNMIKDLPEVLNRLVSLANLSAAHNAINRLPGHMQGLTSLRKLCLDGNPLGQVPTSLLQLSGLVALSMRDCGLAVVPQDFTRLRKLKELHVGDNALETLPELSAMSALRLLRLSNNRLQQLPPTVVRLVDLQELSLSGNQIQKLPVDFSRLTGLQLLQIDGENFDSVPQEVVVQGGGKVLEFVKKIGVAYNTLQLDLAHMGLKGVPPAVLRLVNLQHLSLSDNPIVSVPSSIVRLSKLQSLSLERTKVRSLPIELPGLYECKTIRLDLEEMLFPPHSVCVEGLHAIFQYLRKISSANVVGTLDLSNTGMKDVPTDIAHAAGITKLDLSGNRIVRLPPELSLLSVLQSLDLGNNPLRPHLEDVVSRGLVSIMRYLRGLHNAKQGGKLDLASQELRFYPDEVSLDWGLTYMRLDDNVIRHIPRKFGLLTTLGELSLKGNSLQDLPETMTALQRLRVLLLDGNQFSELPAAVCTLKALERLSLRHNALHSLPADICRLSALRELCVEENPPLETLPFELALLTNLESLTFDSMSISSPDSQFHTDHETIMWYLRTVYAARTSHTLDLSNRGLEYVPGDVLQLTGLTVLSVARNAISTLPDDAMQYLTALQHLDVESNGLVALPESIGLASGLTCVCALGNKIERIPTSLGLVRDYGMLLELDPDRITVPPTEIYRRGISVTLGYLRLLESARGTGSLSLNKFGLAALPLEVTAISGLTDLSLNHNKLAALPPHVHACVSLTRLSATHNLLEALPPELAALTALTALDVSDNPMSHACPSPRMLQRGLPHVMAYFRRLLDAKRNGGALEIGALAHETLLLQGTTLPHLTALILDEAPAYSLQAFTFEAAPEQIETLHTLSLRKCLLDAIPPFVPPLTTVQTLDLSENSFTNVPVAMCRALRGLTTLRMDHNELAEVGDQVSFLTDLTVLSLSHNRIRKLPEVLGDFLTVLKELRCAHNQIDLVPHNLYLCQDSLEVLDLQHNKLMSLPPVALELTRLKALRLEGNRLSELPLSLGRLVFLEELTVPTTDMGNVPRDVVLAGGKAIIRYLCGLEECGSSGLLDLSSMNLHLLPPSVRSVKSSLTLLKLDDNPLQRLPTWLGEFQALERLSLRSTKLSRLPATLGAIAALKEVVVGDDTPNLVSPPPEVVKAGGHAVLAYLRRSYSAVLHHQLDLSGFSLTQFPFAALSTPTTLTSLSLSKNCLTHVPDQLGSLTKLVLLSLSDNQLGELPAHVMACLPALRSLSVQGNKITRLPPTLGALKSLEYVDFDAKMYESPPREVLVKSAQAVMLYLRKAWDGRCSGALDLSSCELSDVPMEVTDWAPLVAEGGGDRCTRTI